MRRKLRPAFLVTASTVGLACQKAPPPDYHINPPGTQSAPPPDYHINPPGTEPTPTTQNPPAIATAPRLEDYTKQVNPTDADKRTIFYAGTKSCYVELPFPALKPNEIREPGTMPPHKNVACPVTFSDPAWEACVGGTISAKDNGAECMCFTMGNPPPPPTRVACPKTR